MAALALSAEGVDKHFAGTPALVGADLSVRPSTVHALLGGNGSGKSTLIKVLAGVHNGDAGEVTVLGRSWRTADGTAKLARAAGLRFVHQDLGLFEGMTIAENIAFDTGFPTRTGGGVRWGSLRRRVATLLDRYEINAGPRTTIGELRPAHRTRVAVARAQQDQEGSQDSCSSSTNRRPACPITSHGCCCRHCDAGPTGGRPSCSSPITWARCWMSRTT